MKEFIERVVVYIITILIAHYILNAPDWASAMFGLIMVEFYIINHSK